MKNKSKEYRTARYLASIDIVSCKLCLHPITKIKLFEPSDLRGVVFAFGGLCESCKKVEWKVYVKKNIDDDLRQRIKNDTGLFILIEALVNNAFGISNTDKLKAEVMN